MGKTALRIAEEIILGMTFTDRLKNNTSKFVLCIVILVLGIVFGSFGKGFFDRLEKDNLPTPKTEASEYGLDEDWRAAVELSTSTTPGEFRKLSNQIFNRKEPDNWLDWRPIHNEIIRTFVVNAAKAGLIRPEKLWTVDINGRYSAGSVQVPFDVDDPEKKDQRNNCELRNCYLMQYTGGVEAISSEEDPSEIIATTSRGFITHSIDMNGERYGHIVADHNSNIPGGFMGAMDVEYPPYDDTNGSINIVLKNRATALCVILDPSSGEWNMDGQPSKIKVAIYKEALVWGLTAPETVSCYHDAGKALKEFEIIYNFPFNTGANSAEFPVRLEGIEDLVWHPETLHFKAFGINYEFNGNKLIVKH
jgi:hypothetical protein